MLSERDQNDNLLSQKQIDTELNSITLNSNFNLQPLQPHEKSINQPIDPIEELLKNNNAIPLLTVIDQIQLERKIEDKPLISILSQRFIPLHQILKGRTIKFPLDDDRRTPLHYAIQADDVKAAAWLIQKGNPNERDNFGNTPILDSIRLGRQRIFLLCLKNKLYDQRAALFAAIYNRHWQLKVLYGMGIDLFAYRDEQNKSAFERALEYCSFDCAEFMIKIKPDLKVQKYKNFTESKGLILRLKKIQKNILISERLKHIIKPFLLLLFICLGLSNLTLGQKIIYEEIKIHYYIIILIIVVQNGLTFFFGTFFTKDIQYNQKSSLSQILKQPEYTTLDDICPVCVCFVGYRQDHCYVCGHCIDKFHFHSFVCVHKGNQIFWVLSQYIWFYLSYSILNKFILQMELNQMSIMNISNFTVIKFITIIDYCLKIKNFSCLVWLIFFVFLFLYQLFYCLEILGMLCLRRRFQQIIHSEKYLHLYQIVKVENYYVNKEKKIIEKGLIPAIVRCLRNLLIYFFISN